MKIKLQEWSNEIRFPPSPHNCPQCQGTTFEDTWPPNYGSFIATGHKSTSSGTVKCVCKSCQITFIVSYINTRDKAEVAYKETVSDIAPLVEKDGIWLTPHDVWREQYKDEHGEYPVVVYG